MTRRVTNMSILFPNFIKIVGVLFLCLGFFFLGLTRHVYMKGKAASEWVPHTAKIQSARVDIGTNSDGRKTYSIDVTYKYEWDGVYYHGDKYRLRDYGTDTGRYDKKRLIVKEMWSAKANDRDYPIFVNALNPRESAVKNTIGGEGFFGFLLMGVIFIFTGLRAVFYRLPERFLPSPK